MIYVKLFDNEMRPCGVAAFEQDMLIDYRGKNMVYD